MTHIISLLVENHQGVLSRIAGLFSGRGYNLESLTAGMTADPSFSRITLVCKGDDAIITQIKKQLNKLIDIVKVFDHTNVPSLNREIALIKVAAKPSQRGEIIQIADVFKARVLDVGYSTMTVEVTGAPEKIDDFISLALEYSIIDVARSGVVSLERGQKQK